MQFGGNDIFIHDNVFHDIGWVLAQNATASDDNIRIYRNSFSRMDHGVACGAGANETVWNMYIYNNHFFDMYNWDTGVNDWYHHDGIHCFSSSTNSTMKNLYIYNNRFDGNAGDCCFTAWVFLQGGPTRWADETGKLFFFNNIIDGSIASTNGQSSFQNGDGHIIANNTVVGGGSSGSQAAVCLNSWTGNTQGITVKNNILSECRQYYRFDANVTSLTANRNIFANLTSGGNPIWQWEFGSNSTSTFTTWQSNSGQDANSVNDPSNAPNVNASWMPDASYAAVGGGENLTSLCSGELVALCSDIYGNPRPAEGAWDIGAVQYTPPPPSSLGGSSTFGGSGSIR